MADQWREQRAESLQQPESIETSTIRQTTQATFHATMVDSDAADQGRGKTAHQQKANGACIPGLNERLTLSFAFAEFGCSSVKHAAF